MATINSLQPELITEILALLGSTSFDDLFRAKISCKMFNRAADDNRVYNKVSLKKFPVVPWRPSRELSDFMGRCRDSGNPDALFRQGVIDFFIWDQPNEGLEALRMAARDGHGEARYILSIIMILSGDEHKEQGIEMLSGMRKAKGAGRRLKEYRENLSAILRSIWIKSPIIKAERPTCCPMHDQHKGRTGWDYKDREIPCDACHCDREVEFVYGLFPRS